MVPSLVAMTPFKQYDSPATPHIKDSLHHAIASAPHAFKGMLGPSPGHGGAQQTPLDTELKIKTYLWTRIDLREDEPVDTFHQLREIQFSAGRLVDYVAFVQSLPDDYPLKRDLLVDSAGFAVSQGDGVLAESLLLAALTSYPHDDWLASQYASVLVANNKLHQARDILAALHNLVETTESQDRLDTVTRLLSSH